MDEEYLKIRKAVNDSLNKLKGINIASSTFQSVFKQQMISLYTRILDDPSTYKIKCETKEEQNNA